MGNSMRFLAVVFSRRTFSILFALLLAGAGSTAVAQDPTTPEAFFGHSVGADYHLTTYEKAMEWFDHLAQHSAGRMLVKEMGQSGMGRAHRYVVISSAENIAGLEEYQETIRRLSLGRDLSPEEAEELAREGKAIGWIDVGLHSTEASPSEHALQLAYDLVTGEDAQSRRIRDEVITLVVFPNPDGMTMVADWYMEHVGTEFEESRMPWLYNRYIGHDNNRDSYNVTQAEVRNVSRLQNQEWFPNVVYNHHQTAPFPTRIWIPPYGEPVNPNKPGEVIRWENLIGAAMGMAFEAEGKPGAVSRVSFDAWYPGFMTQVVTHHNIPSILTETALYYLATPHEYSIDDIPAAWRDFQKSGFYTSPWEGGWWRMGDAVDYCLTASKAVLDVTARYREEMLLSKYRLARANIERFEEEAPYGWIFPTDQRDESALAELLDKFDLLGIEVYSADSDFEASGRQFPQGTFVVPTSQAFGGFVKTLLERQEYPDLREKTHLWQAIPRRIEVEGEPLRPYDVAGWTLSLQMGLEAIELDRPASSIPTSLRKNGESSASVGVELGDAGQGSDVNTARVAVYRPWQGSMDEGWIRWILEHYGYSLTELRNDRIRAGNLKADFETIVLPSVRDSAILLGNKEGSVPPRYVGGIGEEGLEALKAFAREGGTLLFHDRSTGLAVQSFNVPVRVVTEAATDAGFYSAGSILRFSWASDSPLTRGMNHDGVAFVSSRASLFEITGQGEGPVGDPKPLGWFPEEGPLLLSGYLEGGDAIAGAVLALEVPYGEGRLVLVGFSLHNRAQMVANFKLLFNAIE
jgi:hypothetical protein